MTPHAPCRVSARCTWPVRSTSEAMKKDIQEAFERALAGFEKRQEAEHQRVREREKFETEWTE